MLFCLHFEVLNYFTPGPAPGKFVGEHLVKTQPKKFFPKISKLALPGVMIKLDQQCRPRSDCF